VNFNGTTYCNGDKVVVVLVKRAVINMIEIEERLSFALFNHEFTPIWCLVYVSPYARGLVLYRHYNELIIFYHYFK
jgi:hypothetical protein